LLETVKTQRNISLSGKGYEQVFKHKFMEGLLKWMLQSNESFDKDVRKTLYSKEWVVYAKRPFGGPKQVIEYLGRYTL
jgi:hypothetical protein